MKITFYRYNISRAHIFKGVKVGKIKHIEIQE